MTHWDWVRSDRPDIEEYTLTLHRRGMRMDLELWWDDQFGVKPGWCVRCILRGTRGPRDNSRDISAKGRRDSSMKTIHRNVMQAINDDCWVACWWS